MKASVLTFIVVFLPQAPGEEVREHRIVSEPMQTQSCHSREKRVKVHVADGNVTGFAFVLCDLVILKPE